MVGHPFLASTIFPPATLHPRFGTMQGVFERDNSVAIFCYISDSNLPRLNKTASWGKKLKRNFYFLSPECFLPYWSYCGSQSHTPRLLMASSKMDNHPLSQNHTDCQLIENTFKKVKVKHCTTGKDNMNERRSFVSDKIPTQLSFAAPADFLQFTSYMNCSCRWRLAVRIEMSSPPLDLLLHTYYNRQVGNIAASDLSNIWKESCLTSQVRAWKELSYDLTYKLKC